MRIEFDFKEYLKLRKSGATISVREYLVLKFLHECNDEVLDNLAEFEWEMMELREAPDSLIQHLQQGGYIKIIEEEDEYRIELRKKALDFFPENISKGVEFDAFWDNWHEITKMPKTDKEATKRYWRALRVSEKKVAFDNIQAYWDSLNDKRYCKKARTYLKDKNFNDEFKTVQQVATNTGTINEII